MMRFLTSPWFGAATCFLTFSACVWIFLNPAKNFHPPPPQAAATAEHKTVPSWEYKNPELEQLLTEARAERESLRVRAQDLATLEARIKAEWQEITVVTQTVARLQAQLDRTVTCVQQEEATNLKRLGKMYSTMKPDAAAKLLAELEDGQAIRILTMMKDTESAVILESFAKQDPASLKRAAKLSYRLRLTLPPGALEKALPVGKS
jgi:flagellar motility protein MotE (MotC chaperone)